MSIVRHILVLAALTSIAGVIVVKNLPAEGEAVAATHEHARHPGDIEAIAMDGRDLPLAQLRKSIESRVGEQLDSKTIERDRQALATAMVARGYRAAVVETPSVRFDADGGAFVSFPIQAGALYHVRAVKVVGATGTVTTLVEGDEATASAIEGARHVVETAAVRKGGKGADAVVRDVGGGLVDIELVAR